MSVLHQPQPIRPNPALPQTPMHRLRSPIHLVPSCSSPSRRRARPAPRRRRPHLRVDRGPQVFDQLPWINALEAAPEFTDPWDVADLSLLPLPTPPTPISPAGPGPVRRRKTSLRSNPMAGADSPEATPPPLTPCDINSPFLLPSPATPLSSRFNPSRILFRNLMPVSHCDDAYPPPCINIRPSLDL